MYKTIGTILVKKEKIYSKVMLGTECKIADTFVISFMFNTKCFIPFQYLFHIIERLLLRDHYDHSVFM